MGACCVQQGVAIECKTHKKNEIVRNVLTQFSTTEHQKIAK
jgi:hypothetical protein